jgi:hypothetical protein
MFDQMGYVALYPKPLILPKEECIMAMPENSLPAVTATNGSKTPRDRFILGSTECYFELAAYLSGNEKVTIKKVKSLGQNEAMYLADTDKKGRSLKVMIKTPDNETKFLGFVTAGDASISLYKDEHAEDILEAWKTEDITKAITADEVVDLW